MRFSPSDSHSDKRNGITLDQILSLLQLQLPQASEDDDILKFSKRKLLGKCSFSHYLFLHDLLKTLHAAYCHVGNPLEVPL